MWCSKVRLGSNDNTILAKGFPATTVNYDTSSSAVSPSLRHCLRSATMVKNFDPALGEGADLAPIMGLPGDPADQQIYFTGSQQKTSEEYYNSFYARSQELVFLKAANSAWHKTPIDQEQEILFFEGPTSMWRTRNPAEVETAIDARVIALLQNDSDLSPLKAVEMANRQIRDELFHHEELGVRRMSEFWYRLKTADPADPNSDLVLGPDNNPIPVPWDIDRGGALADSEKELATLESPGAWIEIDPSGEVGIKVRWETKGK